MYLQLFVWKIIGMSAVCLLKRKVVILPQCVAEEESWAECTSVAITGAYYCILRGHARWRLLSSLGSDGLTSNSVWLTLWCSRQHNIQCVVLIKSSIRTTTRLQQQPICSPSPSKPWGWCLYGLYHTINPPRLNKVEKRLPQWLIITLNVSFTNCERSELHSFNRWLLAFFLHWSQYWAAKLTF